MVERSGRELYRGADGQQADAPADVLWRTRELAFHDLSLLPEVLPARVEAVAMVLVREQDASIGRRSRARFPTQSQSSVIRLLR